MRKSVLLAVAGATFAGAIGSASPAGAINHVFNGNTYDVTTLTGTFDDLATQITATNNALWGNSTLAFGLADLVGGSEGYPNGNVLFFGPFFAYQIEFDQTLNQNMVNSYAFLENINSTQRPSMRLFDVGTYATATAVPWETDALPVIGSTILFVGGLWAKNKFAKPLKK